MAAGRRTQSSEALIALAFFCREDAALAGAHKGDEFTDFRKVSVLGLKLKQGIGAGNTGEPEQTVGLLEGGNQFL